MKNDPEMEAIIPECKKRIEENTEMILFYQKSIAERKRLIEQDQALIRKVEQYLGK